VARRTARCITAIETRSTVPSPQQISEYFLFYPTVPAADIEWIASDGPLTGYGCHLLVDDGWIKAPCPLQGLPDKPQHQTAFLAVNDLPSGRHQPSALDVKLETRQA
jgi:hypothetical protein